jgi:hypothetical protein
MYHGRLRQRPWAAAHAFSIGSSRARWKNGACGSFADFIVTASGALARGAVGGGMFAADGVR